MCFNEIPSHFSVLWISVVQFSKTDAPDRLSCQRLSYYTPSNHFCQAFFQTFLKKFFEARFSLFSVHSTLSLSSSREAFTVYQIFIRLSRGIFKFRHKNNIYKKIRHVFVHFAHFILSNQFLSPFVLPFFLYFSPFSPQFQKATDKIQNNTANKKTGQKSSPCVIIRNCYKIRATG